MDDDPWKIVKENAEHGRKNPTVKLFQAIADFHKIKLSRLISVAEKK